MKMFKNLIISGALISMISVNIASAAFDWVNFGCQAAGSVIIGSTVGETLKSIGFGYVAKTGANGVSKVAGSTGNFLTNIGSKAVILGLGYGLQNAKPLYDAHTKAVELFKYIDEYNVTGVENWLKDNAITKDTTDNITNGNGPLYYVLNKLKQEAATQNIEKLTTIFNDIKSASNGQNEGKYKVAVLSIVNTPTFKDAVKSLLGTNTLVVNNQDSEQVKTIKQLANGCDYTFIIDGRIRRAYNWVSNNSNNIIMSLAAINTLLN